MFTDANPKFAPVDRSDQRDERARRRRRRFAHARLITGITAAVVAVAAGVAPVVAPAADAADWGPGFSDADNGGLGWLGAFRVGGVTVYCLEGAAPFALGATSGPEYGGWAGLGADDVARLSWATSYGQTDSPVIAAAVQLYVWSVADPAHYNSHGMSGDDWYLPRVPDAHRAAVAAELGAIRSVTAAVTASATTGSGSMRLVIDPVDSTIGTLHIDGLSPSDATGTVVLSNAVDASTGSSTVSGVGVGAEIAIVGIPPTDGSPYRVGAAGDFAAPTGIAGELALYATDGAQMLAGPGRSGEARFQLTATDAGDRTSAFQPIVSTSVSATRVEPGDRFQDVLQFGIAADETGRTNRWARDQQGAPVPITAACLVYGPFSSPPAPAETPPADAPIATSFTVTTSGDGPDGVYAAASDDTLPSAGYYTATCSIDAESQLSGSRAFLPADYRFSDGFGLVAETAVVPFRPAISTSLVPAIVGLGDDVIDEVTIAVASGPWLTGADGASTAVELVGRFTFVTTEPVRAAEAPADALVISEQRLVVTGPGTVPAEPVVVPRREGWVVAQWCALDAEAVVRVCDDWGVPGEIAVVAAPIVTTLADPTARPDGVVRDTAIVDGPVPAGGLFVEFNGYLQPPGSTAPECTDQTLVFASTAPVVVTGAGTWPSETFSVTDAHLGTIHWIETARDVEGTVIAEGRCGLVTETTLVSAPRPLALTGSGGGAEPAPLLAGGLGLLGVVLIGSSLLRRRAIG
jgi:hypothetical protein